MSKRHLTALQLTDFHLFADTARCLASVNTFQSVSQTLQAAAHHHQLRPDLIFLTGDISQDYSQASYRLARQLLDDYFPEIPIYATCGNHEEPKHFRLYFGEAMHRLDQVGDFTGWRFIILNSQMLNNTAGLLDESNLAFLSDQLRDCSKPTAILMHHHILPVGCQWLDNINLLNYQQLLDIIKPYPQVKLVISGHVHQSTYSYGHAVTFITTPSASWQFTLNHDQFQLGSSMPGCRWFKFTNHGQFTTSVQRIKYCDVFVPDQIAGY